MATAFAMPTPPDELAAYLVTNGAKSLLRFLTCGSVDDGKSTLIGRLLWDTRTLFDDQITTLEADSRRQGTQGTAPDLALLVDGLAAEREQGITIDVAYRFLATARRKFIVADTPGHEQYTRNMVTGASTADLAVILVDARKGVLAQTRRHSLLVHLLGIRRLVLAVNKMDLIGHDSACFDAIVADYHAFADDVGIGEVVAIPMSGLTGDNVVAPTTAMPWYRGPSLLEHLETVSVGDTLPADAPFRMPVQWVNRPNARFRGYAGTVGQGSVRPGDPITVLPSGARTRVGRIVAWGDDLEVATAGQSITLTFTDEVDCSRGDLLASQPVPSTRDINATLVWMAEERLATGRAYLLKLGAQTLSATVSSVDEIVDIDTGRQKPGRLLRLNDIGRCRIALDRGVPAIPYDESRALGGFILIDKITHATVAAGMIRAVRAEARPTSPSRVDNEAKRILWVRGSTDAGRSAAARRAVKRFERTGRRAFVLDAATLRAGLNGDLGDGQGGAAERLRRTREVARLLARAGVHVLIDLDVPDAEAHPGRMTNGVDGAQSSQDWTI